MLKEIILLPFRILLLFVWGRVSYIVSIIFYSAIVFGIFYIKYGDDGVERVKDTSREASKIVKAVSRNDVVSLISKENDLSPVHEKNSDKEEDVKERSALIRYPSAFIKFILNEIVFSIKSIAHLAAQSVIMPFLIFILGAAGYKLSVQAAKRLSFKMFSYQNDSASEGNSEEEE